MTMTVHSLAPSAVLFPFGACLCSSARRPPWGPNHLLTTWYPSIGMLTFCLFNLFLFFSEVCVCWYICRFHESMCILTPAATLKHFPSYLLGRVSLWNASLLRAASLASLLTLGFPHKCLWNAAVTGRPPGPQWLYFQVWNLNSRPHTFKDKHFICGRVSPALPFIPLVWLWQEKSRTWQRWCQHGGKAYL